VAQMQLIHGTAHHLPLHDKTIHCVVTSPPYYGLRAYGGVEASLWPGGAYAPVPGSPPITVGCWRGTLGNEPDVCSFIWHTLLWLRDVRRILRDDGVVWIVIGDSFAGGGGYAPQAPSNQAGSKQSSNAGSIAGAHIPAGYPQGSLLGIPAQVMLAAMADGWVVRNDVVWSKNSPMPESVRGWRHEQARCRCVSHTRGREPYRNGSIPAKPQSDHDPAHSKDFAPAQPDPACPTCGGTGRLATEVLRKGSWRHTRATETVLMLTKGMQYFANGEAVREEASWQRPNNPDWQYKRAATNVKKGMENRNAQSGGFTAWDSSSGRNPRNVLHDVPSAAGELASLLLWLVLHRPDVLEAYQEGQRIPTNVVTPAQSPLGYAHYASFPPGLIEPLIRATCPERSCPTCGMGWAPAVTARTEAPAYRPTNKPIRSLGASSAGQGTNGTGESTLGMIQSLTFHGLRPACPHYCTCGPLAPEPGLLVQDRTCPRCAKLLLAMWASGIVFDPFVGSGTTLAVARALGRHAIGVDRSWPYLSTIARSRLGLTDLAAWEGAPAPPPPITYSDLPLFTALAGTTPIAQSPPAEEAADSTD
jgi:DNA modification methylase